MSEWQNILKISEEEQIEDAKRYYNVDTKQIESPKKDYDYAEEKKLPYPPIWGEGGKPDKVIIEDVQNKLRTYIGKNYQSLEQLIYDLDNLKKEISIMQKNIEFQIGGV